MKRFSFRLESVLNRRKYLEKQAQRDLYQAKNAYMRTEKSIAHMKGFRKEISGECSRKESQGIAVPSHRIYKTFIDRTDHDLSDARVELDRIGEEVKDKTAALNKALVKKKTMETLKRAQHQTYLEHLEKENQKAMDELVITRRGHGL